MDKLYIANGQEPLRMTLDLLNRVNPLQNGNRNMTIGIKPNLVCASPPNQGATTHPEIVEGIIIYLLDKGYKNIRIIESSWIGDSTRRAFKVCGYESLSEK